MAKKTFPLSEVYRLLEPGPVVMVTTAHKGKTNIMTHSWHTMMEFEPPLIGCVISGRNHSFDALAKQVVKVGNRSDSKAEMMKRLQLSRIRMDHEQESYGSIQ